MNSTLTPHPQLSIWNQVWLSPNTPIPSSILKMWTSPPAPWAPNLCTDASSSKSWDTYLSLLLRTHIQTHMPLSCYYSPPQLAFPVQSLPTRWLSQEQVAKHQSPAQKSAELPTPFLAQTTLSLLSEHFLNGPLFTSTMLYSEHLYHCAPKGFHL